MKIPLILFLVFIPIPAFAQDETGFQESFTAIFDWLNEIFTGTISDSGLENDTQTNLQNTLDSGTDAGKQGTILWFKVHEFIVDGIFVGADEADLPVSKDMIVIISMILTTILIGLIAWSLIKKGGLIAVIVIAILIVLGILGVVIEF